MALKTQKTPLGAIVPVLPGDQGRRLYLDMENAVQTHRLQFTVEADVQISVGAATAIRNRGSVLAMIDEMGVEEAGGERTVLDGRLAGIIAQAYAPSTLSATRQTALAVATYTLRESISIHYASPISANPAETTFRERNVKRRLQAFVKFKTGNLGDNVLQAGAATLTVTNVRVRIRHTYDDRSTSRPFYIPTYRQQVAQVASANTDLKEEVKTEKFLRLVAIQQDSDVGEVPDIIRAVEFRGDRRHIIGPNKIAWDDLARDQEEEFGGAVYSPATVPPGLGQNAYLVLNFQKGGRLSNIINPNDDTNLRFVFDAAPSAVAGAANGKIRLGIVELEQDPNLTRPVEEAREQVPA